MTIESLVNLIAGADRKHKGCTVEFFHIEVHPPDGAPAHGVVRWGFTRSGEPSNERTFHSVEELARYLTRLQ